MALTKESRSRNLWAYPEGRQRRFGCERTSYSPAQLPNALLILDGDFRVRVKVALPSLDFGIRSSRDAASY